VLLARVDTHTPSICNQITNIEAKLEIGVELSALASTTAVLTRAGPHQ
jgi:hypothetical protein